MLVMTLASFNAYADGFVCRQVDGDISVKVFNNTNPNEGTRNGAVMVISDNSVQGGRKTVARFLEVTNTLSNEGAHYIANVDLRYSDSRRQGELLFGTKLGYIDTVDLFVNFSYRFPMNRGEITEGTIVITKRNGETISEQMDCVRYLKGRN